MTSTMSASAYGCPMPSPAMSYGVGTPLDYGPPTEPLDHLVIRPPVVVMPEPDPGASVNCDVAALVAGGMTNVDALRLLMLCGWSLRRATLVCNIGKQYDLDPLEFARKYVQGEAAS